MIRCLVVLALSTLHACGTPTPIQAPLASSVDLLATTACATAWAGTDFVFLALQDNSIVVLDAGVMQEEPGVKLDFLPTCLAVDGQGVLALGNQKGDSLLYDFDRASKRLRERERDRVAPAPNSPPVTAIATLAGAPPLAADATAAGPAQPPAVVSTLRARLNEDVTLSRTPALGTDKDKDKRDDGTKPIKGLDAFFVRAIVADPTANRWHLLADGALFTVANPNTAAGTAISATAKRFADAAGARAMAWSGKQVAVVGKEALLIDPSASAGPVSLPYDGRLTLLQVAASEALGYVAAIDELGGLHRWRRDASAWQAEPAEPGPSQEWQASHVLLCEPSRRLLLFETATNGKGRVRRIELSPRSEAAAHSP
jgi:hypothetical protein